MRHVTVRDLPAALAHALKQETRRRGKSLNQTVKELLQQALGLDDDAQRDNGLGRFAGGWSEEEWREFEEATRPFERIDEELWRR